MMKKIDKIGIVGAGSMGAGIAQVAAMAGYTVYLYDQNKETVKSALEKLDAILNRLIEKGRISKEEKQHTLKCITVVDQISEFKKADFVIEAIIEDLEIKKTLFHSLSQVIMNDCILATNTSSLSVTNLASSAINPSRFLGVHFFNPAPLMPLVEVIPALQTDDTVSENVISMLNDWKKTPVIAKDTPGFIVNRIARPFYGEALRIYEEGIADFHSIDESLKQGGFRMGPFELMDFIGNDVNYAVTKSVFEAFYFDPRYKPSFTQKQYAEAGWLGRKSGRGYYHYNADPVKVERIDNAKAKDIFERILVMLINEAVDALYLQIASEQDIELAMTKGVNYPKGLISWGREFGFDWCEKKLDALYHQYHEDRYRCSPLIRKWAK